MARKEVFQQIGGVGEHSLAAFNMMLLAGILIYQRLRPHFADVI